MLIIEKVTKRFQGPKGLVTAMEDVSFTVETGGFVAIQGPSGSGKTTLMLAIGALQRPDTGRITLNHQDPYALDPEERAKFRAASIGFVFQQYHLVPYLSVLDNVLAPMIAQPRTDAEDRARQLIARFGLESRAHHIPAALSAGERQRTALARALFHEPKLLLADEPTGNLDRASAEVVLRYLVEFSNSGGTVVLVTHDEKIAGLAQRVVHMEQGRLR